jgi:hypothetical protein
LVGWFAAAACLIVALIIWEERPVRVVIVPTPAVTPATVRAAPESSTPVAAARPSSNQTEPGSRVAEPVKRSDRPVVDPAAQREHLLASNPRVLRRPWRAGNDAAGLTVSGDIVWDPGSQTGFMRFIGLRRNEPNAEQYQLWIFDARRDERYPVDGGVFNITGARQGDVIPIKAALRIEVPLTFAVTIEKPGGVVVSDRARVAAILGLEVLNCVDRESRDADHRRRSGRFGDERAPEQARRASSHRRTASDCRALARRALG